MELVIKNLVTEDQIRVNQDKLFVIINDDKFEMTSGVEIQFLYNLILHNHGVLNYSEIRKIVYEYNSEVYDHIDYIRKTKNKLSNFFKDNGIQSVIKNVPKIGYKLNHNWNIIEEKEAQNSLVELNKCIEIVLKSIDSMDFIRFEEDNELRTKVRIPKAYEETIFNNVIGYKKTTSKILSDLRLSPFEFEYLLVLKLIQEIFSYIKFERVGGDIEEDDWKKIFKIELLNKYESLIKTIEL